MVIGIGLLQRLVGAAVWEAAWYGYRGDFSRAFTY